TEIVSKVFSVAEELYKTFQQVKSNRYQCQRLVDRVKMVIDYLQRKEKAEHVASSEGARSNAFVQLIEVIVQIKEYIEKYENYGAIKKFMKSSDAQENFELFHERLNDIIPMITLQDINMLDRTHTYVCPQNIMDATKDFREDLTRLILNAVLTETGRASESQQEEMKKTISTILNIAKDLVNTGKSRHPVEELREIKLDEIVNRKKDITTIKYSMYKGEFCQFPVWIKHFKSDMSSYAAGSKNVMLDEAKKMRELDSENIIRLYGIIVDPSANFFAIVMEYCSRGTLRELLQSAEPLSWRSKVHMAMEGARALCRMHSMKSPVCYRNVCTDKFLVNEHYTIKLSDLGFARTCTSICRSSTNRNSSESMAFIAPERQNDLNYKPIPSCDIYSYGVVMWEIAARKIPFEGKDMKAIRSMVMNGKSEPLPEDCPEALKTLIDQARECDVPLRPGAAELVRKLLDLHEDLDL
uniref:Protein kinase domain-containing protein n=1 Tax=Petromyzon marinus TaxID=7757 RepID=S4RPX7_PETMA